jgi:hypothetical protein
MMMKTRFKIYCQQIISLTIKNIPPDGGQAMEKNKNKNTQAVKNRSMLELCRALGIPAKNTTSECLGQSLISCIGWREEEDLKKAK